MSKAHDSLLTPYNPPFTIYNSPFTIYDSHNRRVHGDELGAIGEGRFHLHFVD